MRRHVETSNEKQAILGIVVLCLCWLVALIALSAAAQGQERLSASASARENAEQAPLTRFILVSIPGRQLALIDDGQVVKVYPVAVGAAHSPSPEGIFTIVSQAKNPTYSHRGKVALPGRDNPVGTRWMGLSRKGYGIHGTNVPGSIGKAASHGCIRMRKDDLEELYKLVRVGDTVAIRHHGDALTAQVFSPAAPAAVAAANLENHPNAGAAQGDAAVQAAAMAGAAGDGAQQ